MALFSAYNKFISKNPQVNPLFASKIRSLASSRSKTSISELKKEGESHLLPRIPRFRSMSRNEEDKIEKELY